MVTVHATCIAFNGKGVLLRGPPGSGKSDLALRALASGARLVADDRVDLMVRGDTILASAPQTIFGLVEVRGLGLLRIDAEREAALALVVDLVAPDRIERLPERRHCELLGLSLPWSEVTPFESSAVAKLRFALMAAEQPELLLQ